MYLRFKLKPGICCSPADRKSWERLLLQIHIKSAKSCFFGTSSLPPSTAPSLPVFPAPAAKRQLPSVETWQTAAKQSSLTNCTDWRTAGVPPMDIENEHKNVYYWLIEEEKRKQLEHPNFSNYVKRCFGLVLAKNKTSLGFHRTVDNEKCLCVRLSGKGLRTGKSDLFKLYPTMLRHRLELGGGNRMSGASLQFM